MRKATYFIALLVVVCFAAAAFAQGAGQGGRRGRAGVSNYDPKTETTVKGTVTDVVQQTGKRSTGGTHLTIDTEQGTFDVHVGPSSYLTKQNVMFAKGDAVEVTGSKVTIGGKDALIAREIKKDGKTITLRDAQGIPAWSRRAGRS